MNLIVDTSVLIAVIAGEPPKQRLIELTSDATLLAPASVHWEIGNAFSAMLRRGRISVDQAVQALAVYHEIPVRFVDVDLDEALRIAARANIYAYDAYLISAARRYRSPLLSLDRALIQAAVESEVEVMEVNQ